MSVRLLLNTLSALSIVAVSPPPLQVETEMAGASKGTQYAIIIDGKALSFALHPTLAPLFLKVGQGCLTSVV